MALADALLAIAYDWRRIAQRLSPEELESIRRGLAAAVHGARWDAGAVLAALLAHERADHPAWQALDLDVARRTGPPVVEPLVAAARLRWFIEMSGSKPRESRRGTSGERVAEDHVWAVPMRPLDEVEAARWQLVVLRRAGRELTPAFQFDDRGRVLPSAARINHLLNANDDPWGAASWWLTPHAALHAIPADELRTGSEARVLAAAAATAALD